MTGAGPWTFEYAGLPDEGVIEAPHIWIEIRGPARSEEYPCLLDTGAGFSAFPLEVADELGVDQAILEPASISTVGGQCEVLQLRDAQQMSVAWNGETVPIAPFFFPPEVIEGEKLESDYYILGRDFLLGVDATFQQGDERVVLIRRA